MILMTAVGDGGAKFMCRSNLPLEMTSSDGPHAVQPLRQPARLHRGLLSRRHALGRVSCARRADRNSMWWIETDSVLRSYLVVLGNIMWFLGKVAVLSVVCWFGGCCD